MRFSAASVGLLGLPLVPSALASFAVLRFNGNDPLMQGSVDPITDPGRPSSHSHVIQGASNFGMTVDAASLTSSKCTTAKIGGDHSVYWMPKLYFHDKDTGKFESVPFFYMNVYYFFEDSDDEIVAFPPGLQILAGDPSLQRPLNNGTRNLDPSVGDVTAASWTCPRQSYDVASWPAGSDGTKTGIPIGQGEGFGFPVQQCDGVNSPLRADVHMPSCYDPSKKLTDYKNNMVYPKSVGSKQNCPKGMIHVPHLFYEVYWLTQEFADRWTPDGETQPFVLSNGDTTGYSLHADFIAGWEESTLQTIIDTCNAGSIGMQDCPQLPQGLNSETEKCTIKNPVDEVCDGVLDALPGNNPLKGYNANSGGGDHDHSPEPSASEPSSTAQSTKSKPATKTADKPTKSEEPASKTTAPAKSSESESQATEAAAVDNGNSDNSSDDNNGPSTKVVTEMQTVWETVYVTVDAASEPTPVDKRDAMNAHMKRHQHHHGRL